MAKEGFLWLQGLFIVLIIYWHFKKLLYHYHAWFFSRINKTINIFCPLMYIWDEVPLRMQILFQHPYIPWPHSFPSLDASLYMHRTFSVEEFPRCRVLWWHRNVGVYSGKKGGKSENGLQCFSLPTISTHTWNETAVLRKYFSLISSFGWVSTSSITGSYIPKDCPCFI